MNFSLSIELEHFIQERVESGLYSSASEVVRDSLRLLRDKVLSEKQQLIVELNQFIDEGLADADEGRLLNGEEAYAQSIAQLKRIGYEG